MASFEVKGLVSSPPLQVICIAMAVVNFVMPLVMIKWLFLFNLKRKHALMAKRHSKLMRLFIIGCIVLTSCFGWAILGMPVSLAPIVIIVPLWLTLGVILIIGSITIRFWLIRYDTKLAIVGLSKQWQVLIDSKSHTSESNWYIKHKNDLGNANFLSKYGFSLLAIIGIANIAIAVNRFVE